jgi:hypothetical protein
MTSRADDVTLIDLLVNGFEKNESIGGWHWRQLPAPDAATAIRKFEEFAAEGRRWKGKPLESVSDHDRRALVWSDLQIRQKGRGVLVAGKSENVASLWHEDDTWDGDPMGDVFDWFSESASVRPASRPPLGPSEPS